jgi:hypothetical protein
LTVAGRPGRIVMALGEDEKKWPADPISIRSGRIENDTLFMVVTYGGGCQEHEYALIASNGWLESAPVQVHAFLAHDAKGDICKALKGADLKFDLTPARDAYRALYLRNGGSGEFIIVIRNSDLSGTATPALRLLYRF